MVILLQLEIHGQAWEKIEALCIIITLHRQTTVTAYFSSEQLLLFAFVGQYLGRCYETTHPRGGFQPFSPISCTHHVYIYHYSTLIVAIPNID